MPHATNERTQDSRDAGAHDAAGAALTDGSLERAGWALAALSVLVLAMQAALSLLLPASVRALMVLLVLAAVLAIAAVWVLPRRSLGRLGWVLLVLWVIGFAAASIVQVKQQTGLGSDELAFNQRSAELLLKGINPYGVSFQHSFERFLVPTTWRTYLLGGGSVAQLSYPSLSFLLIEPALLLGFHEQAGTVTDFAAWAATVVILFFLLPRPLRWIAPVVGSLSEYVGGLTGGVTDATFMPFLLVAVWRWDRFGDADERSPARWLGPIAMGLAMSIKQIPWLILPLLLIAIAYEGRARGVGGVRLASRYAAIALGTFLLVNLPFVAWNPGAWAHAVLLPLTAPTVPAGAGLVSLVLLEHLGGQLAYLRFAGVLGYLLVLAAWLGFYPQLKRAMVPLVSLAFFWAARSLGSYFVDLVPAALVAGLSVRPAPAAALGASIRRFRWAGVGTVAALFAIALVAAVAAQSPISLRVQGTRVATGLQAVEAVRVRVTNASDQRVTPWFTVQSGGGAPLAGYWRAEGAQTVPANSSRVLTVNAPSVAAMPPLGVPWKLVAFTSSPASVATAQTIAGGGRQLTLEPSVIPLPVPAGAAVHLRVQLRYRLGRPVEASGVRIALSQVRYTEAATLPANASINAGPAGARGVAVTDSRGVAEFLVRALPTQREKTYFQAFATGAAEVESPPSPVVLVTFIPRR